MTTTIHSKPWDLSHVLDLVNSLSSPAAENVSSGGKENEHGRSQRASKREGVSSGRHNTYDGIAQHDFAPESESQVPTPKVEARDGGSGGLGNFANIWQYLGTPAHLPSSSREAVSLLETDVSNYPSKDDYASDGAMYFKLSTGRTKTVRWQDIDSAEDPTTEAVSDSSVVPDSPTLTKTQRKKKNRKERKARERALGPEQAARKANVSESEADVIAKSTPARKASAHMVSSEPKKRTAPRVPPFTTSSPMGNGPDPLIAAASLAAQKVAEAKKAKSGVSNGSNAGTPSKPARSSSFTVPRRQSQSGMSQTVKAGPPPSQPSKDRQSTQWPPTTPKAEAKRFLPASVQPNKQQAARSASTLPAPSLQNTVPSKPSRAIEPMIVRSGEDRHWALLMKLIADFYEDRKHLISPMNLTKPNNNTAGLHVFVDASNIFIGFNDQLKRSRGIPDYYHMPPAHLSFDALALLMERRRPVAKRVLVGSTPHLPAFDKAKQVGYECSILEKVYKARELTERQIFFKEHDRFGVRKRAKATASEGEDGDAVAGPGVGGGSGASGSETSAGPQYAPARMIEQGVDEILHLKMLESIVDADEAPSTIVLATGDAAQAEYSSGFMAMVERALKKGWTVELVSWSKSINGLYKRRGWKERWGERFRIVSLDDYAEELLDM